MLITLIWSVICLAVFFFFKYRPCISFCAHFSEDLGSGSYSFVCPIEEQIKWSKFNSLQSNNDPEKHFKLLNKFYAKKVITLDHTWAFELEMPCIELRYPLAETEEGILGYFSYWKIPDMKTHISCIIENQKF